MPLATRSVMMAVHLCPRVSSLSRLTQESRQDALHAGIGVELAVRYRLESGAELGVPFHHGHDPSREFVGQEHAQVRAAARAAPLLPRSGGFQHAPVTLHVA